MSTFLKGINKAPDITYRWLRVNDTTIEKEDFPEVKNTVNVNITGKEYISIEETKNVEYLYSSAQVGDEYRKYVEENGAKQTTYTVVKSPKTLIRMEYFLQEETIIERERLVIEEGVNVTILCVYRGCGTQFQVREILAKKGSNCKVLKINLLADTSLAVTEVIVKAEEDAKVEVVHVNMGEEITVDNINMNLDKKAVGNITGLYLSGNEDKVDMNYTTVFHDKESSGDIDVKGVLLDKAQKIFRGTIDFRRGASGSAGSESEEVMLLSDEVKNVAVPIILCGEDDVKGEHAASCGRIDEDKLFYLMSRGLSLEESKKMIVEGAFYPILNKIPDEALITEISNMIQRRLA
jgi:ABC-type transport system involved in Fe-S cluster assembly, permease component